MQKIILILLLINITYSQQALATAPVTPMPAEFDAGVIDNQSRNTIQIEKKKEELLIDKKNKPASGAEIDTTNIQKHSSPDSSNIKVLINDVIVDKSEILSQQEINDITCELKGKNATIEDINNAVFKINNLYKSKDCVTAKAILPPQKLDGGVVIIKLIEGHVGKIVVMGNKHTREAYIVDKLTQQPDDILQLKILENDLIKFNNNNDVKLRAKLKAGAEVGTTDVYLIATDPNPFHITPTFDGAGRESVGVLRGGLSFTDDSLTGYRDRLTIGTNLARSTNIAYANYDYPIFNHGTRVGGSFSFSRINVTQGEYENFDIVGHSYNYGTFITHPIISKPNFNLTSNLGFNFKQSRTFWADVPLPGNQVRSLVTGFNARYDTKNGIWYSNHNFSNGLDILGGNAKFFKYEGNLIRVHNFGHGIVGLFRAETQLTPDVLVPVEQYQLGGISSVRGFTEGLVTGNNAYLLSSELMFPMFLLPKKVQGFKLRDRVKGVMFIDHGGSFPYRGRNVSARHTDYLTSMGLGLRVSISKYLAGRLYWGFGLGRDRDAGQPTARFHFDLQSSPF